MAEKDTIFSGKIKQTGNFDFKDFYSFTYDWLNDEGYTVIEKKYSEKVSGESKDIEIIWEAAKKISDYFKFMIKMNWTIGGLKNIEATKDGRKIKTNSGLVEIKFSAVLIKDYESRWEDHPLWKFLRGVYDRYMIRSSIEEYEGKLIGNLDELIAQCKSYLAIEAKK